MKSPRVLPLNNRKVTMQEFGRIVYVGEDDAWICIRNEESVELYMKKLYHKWPNVLFKCKKYKAFEMNVVTQCASTSSYLSYFNEVYADPPNAPLLNVPKDGENAPQTVEQLVFERIWNMEQWARSIEEKGNIESERDRYIAALAQQGGSERALTEISKKYLSRHYDEFSLNRILLLSVSDRVKTRAALRLGIDLTQVSELRVYLECHLWNTNYIHVTLIDYEGIGAVIGLHIKKDGKHSIATINNGDSGWWKHETQILGEKKVTAPISHWLHLFKQIQASRHSLERLTHDVGVDHLAAVNIIPFPKA